MLTAVDLTGSEKDIETILALVKRHDWVDEVSEPTSLDASRALNVGLPHLDPTTVLIFLTVVFKAGAAALEFLKARHHRRRHSAN